MLSGGRGQVGGTTYIQLVVRLVLRRRETGC
jgi:hypothetical protein